MMSYSNNLFVIEMRDFREIRVNAKDCILKQSFTFGVEIKFTYSTLRKSLAVTSGSQTGTDAYAIYFLACCL